MDEIKLKRTLNSIGKACFVKYYYLFKDETLSNMYLATIIISKEGYEESATITRIRSAQRIFKNNMNIEALNLVINSKKIDVKIKEKALEYLNFEGKK